MPISRSSLRAIGEFGEEVPTLIRWRGGFAVLQLPELFDCSGDLAGVCNVVQIGGFARGEERASRYVRQPERARSAARRMPPAGMLELVVLWEKVTRLSMVSA